MQEKGSGHLRICGCLWGFGGEKMREHSTIHKHYNYQGSIQNYLGTQRHCNSLT